MQAQARSLVQQLHHSLSTQPAAVELSTAPNPQCADENYILLYNSNLTSNVNIRYLDDSEVSEGDTGGVSPRSQVPSLQMASVALRRNISSLNSLHAVESVDEDFSHDDSLLEAREDAHEASVENVDVSMEMPLFQLPAIFSKETTGTGCSYSCCGATVKDWL